MVHRQTDRPTELSASAAAAALTSPPVPAWWPIIQRHSQILVAVVTLQTLQIEWTSDRFRALVGMDQTPPTLGEAVLPRLSPTDQALVRERVRRHVLNAVLSNHYQQPNLLSSRWLHEPLIVAVGHTETQGLGSATDPRPRYVEFTVSSDRITLTHLSDAITTRLQTCWPHPPDAATLLAQLHQPESLINQVMQQLTPDHYQASGTILVEGMDVTDRELTQRLTHLLLGRESILQPERFKQANVLIKQLFRAEDSLILTAEANDAKIFVDIDQPEWTVLCHPVGDFQTSALFQAAIRGEVCNVPDLSRTSSTPCETLLRDRHARSVLVLPLVIRAPRRLQQSAPLMGLIALSSSQPDAFDSQDEYHALSLVPALTVAMRHTAQERFSQIHPSVQWRFEEEAERRSLGLSPAPIVFQNVYPLYGISDIRGSSHERNRAIQADLLHQFDLAIAILETVGQTTDVAFLRQLQWDVTAQRAHLAESITVDAEITLLRYLQDRVEVHFDYFRQQGTAAIAAINAYKAAQHPEQGAVYDARGAYDRTIQHINQTLRATWQRWQRTMQAITPHYCDVEATDGIDHMLYAGQAIDEQFTPFHLRSLRYDQLRAICDCARTGFHLKADHHTDLDLTHLVLVQDSTVDITHDEHTERLFDVRGTRDTRYEIVKKRIDKALDATTKTRITQPGCLTLVYSTNEEWREYEEYLRYLRREGWIGDTLEQGLVEPLQGVTGLHFVRVPIIPSATDHQDLADS
jgi:hypothetical protein